MPKRVSNNNLPLIPEVSSCMSRVQQAMHPCMPYLDLSGFSLAATGKLQVQGQGAGSNDLKSTQTTLPVPVYKKRKEKKRKKEQNRVRMYIPNDYSQRT